MVPRPVSSRGGRRPIALHAQSSSGPEIVQFKVCCFFFHYFGIKMIKS